MRKGKLDRATKKKLRAEDIKEPRKINDDDFEDICATFDIRKDAAEFLREFLDEFVDAFVEAIRRDHGSPTMTADRDVLKESLSAVEKARQTFERKVGPAGLRALRAFGHKLGPALSARWLREQIPDAELPQQTLYDGPGYFGPSDRAPDRLPARPPVGREYDVEDLSINDRAQCVSGQPLQVICAFLSLVEVGLTESLQGMLHLPGARGGQKPLVRRKDGLINLAQAWHNLGRKPTSGANSQFLAFCEAIFAATGWPTDGIQAAVPGAIKSWRNLTGKIKK
jgi:hypothetical protein